MPARVSPILFREGLSQDEIAVRLGISRARVSYLERRALAKLSALIGSGAFPALARDEVITARSKPRKGGRER